MVRLVASQRQLLIMTAVRDAGSERLGLIGKRREHERRE